MKKNRKDTSFDELEVLTPEEDLSVGEFAVEEVEVEEEVVAAPVAPEVKVEEVKPVAVAKPVDEKAAAIQSSPFAQFMAEPAAPAPAPAPAPAQNAAAENPFTKPLIINGAVFKPLPNQGPQPIVTPSSHVQLTPIVVPIAMVPFATQNQPVMQYADEDAAPAKKAAAPAPAAEAKPAAAVTEDAVYYEEEPVEYVTDTDEYVDDVVSDSVINPASELSVSTYSAEKEGKKAKKEKGGGRGRAVVMLFASLVLMLPFLLKYAVSGGLFGAAIANKELFAGISLSKMADGFFSSDLIGSFINAFSTKNFDVIFGSIPSLLQLAVFAVAAFTFVFSIVGIIGGFRFKYWISGLTTFVLTFASLVVLLLSSAMTENGFAMDALVSGVLGNIGLVKLFLISLLVFIVSMLVRFKKEKEPKESKVKKEKKSKKAPEIFEPEFPDDIIVEE